MSNLFALDGAYHWKKRNGDVEKVSNFTLEVIESRVRQDGKSENAVFTFLLKITTKTFQRSILTLATGNDLKSPDAMTGFFLRHAKANWNGGPEATNALRLLIIESDAPDDINLQQTHGPS